MNLQIMNNESALYNPIDCQSTNRLKMGLKEDIILERMPSNGWIEQQIDASSQQDGDISTLKLLDTKKLNKICTFDSFDRYLETISWEGYIESISEEDETITGRMHEIGTVGTDESVIFDFNDVSPDDSSLVKVGAIFYYSIGYALTKGQKKKEALLRFKRSVNFTENDVDKISDDVRQLVDGINWE